MFFICFFPFNVLYLLILHIVSWVTYYVEVWYVVLLSFWLFFSFIYCKPVHWYNWYKLHLIFFWFRLYFCKLKCILDLYVTLLKKLISSIAVWTNFTDLLFVWSILKIFDGSVSSKQMYMSYVVYAFISPSVFRYLFPFFYFLKID